MKTEDLLQTATAVVENTNILKSAMTWEMCGTHCAIMAGILAEANGIIPDAEKYQACRKLLKKKISVLSGLRGNADPMIVSKMMQQDDPEAYLEKLKSVYAQLKDFKVWVNSPYSVLALLTLAESSDMTSLIDNINRYDAIYKILHANHSIMVNHRDRGVLAMLAVNGVNAEKANEVVETNYIDCKAFSSTNDAAYSLAEILALSTYGVDRNIENVEKMIELLSLSARKIDKVEGLTFYGALTLLDDYLPEEVALAVRKVDDFFAEQKVFKSIEVDKKTRTLYASLVVLITYARVSGRNKVVNETLIRALLEQLILALIEAAQAAAAAAAT